MKLIEFFKQIFCSHRWTYNYKNKYYRCKDCKLKINKI